MAHIHSNALIGASGAAAGAAGAADYIIPKSLRFNSGDSAHLSKTFASKGNRRTWTWSAWVKLDVGSGASNFFAAYNGSYAIDSFIQFYYDGNSDTFNVYQGGSLVWKSTEVLRDPAAWYHLVIAFDTTQSTADDRLKVYLNSKQLTRATGAGFSQNTEYAINNNIPHRIGTYSGSTEFFKGLMADIQFIDGLALAPTDFGETRSSDGVWVPKEYSRTSVNDGTVWSNGKTGSDLSGYPATNGFDGNTSNFFYAAASQTTTFTFSPAITGTTFEIYALSGGLWPEISVNGTGIGTHNSVWVDVSSQANGSLSTIACPGDSVRQSGFAAVRVDGEILIDDFNDSSGYGRNGFHLNFSDSSTIEALGFDSAPTIPDLDPKKGMDVVTYSGNGGLQNIGGLNFEPGLVWLKTRTGHSSKTHGLFDVVRGPTKFLASNSNAAENTSYDNNLTAFNPDGFRLEEEPDFNTGGRTYVGWCWAAGGTAVANTSGTITSQVSTNTDYGFSIVTWTNPSSGSGAFTVGHGLGAAPSLIFIKARSNSGNWNTFHSSGTTDTSKFLNLNTSDSLQTYNGLWGSALPTSSVFGLGGNFRDGYTMVAYCWSEVSGYSKFGSYSGSGSANKTVTGLGFKPKFLIVKRTDALENWQMVDSERGPDKPLFPDLTDAEQNASGGTREISFQDDGFTLVGTHAGINASGGTYIYIAFADRPGNNFDVNNIVTNEGLSTSKTQFDVVTYTGNGGTNIIGGVVYSEGATATGGFEGSNPAANGFNGTLTAGDRANGVTVGGTIEIVFSPGLSVSSTVGIWSGKSGFKYQINDSGSYTSVTNATEQWHDASFSGTLTNLKIQHTASNEAPGFSGIRVDGSTLIDGDGGPGLKFQPDFVWIKTRSHSQNHGLFDSVRGAGRSLRSSTNGAEQGPNTGTNGDLRSFNSNGFTVGSCAASGAAAINVNNQTQVAWCWKAGGPAVSNTDGSITSSVSANTAYGFSIVTFTGTGSNATVGHGLNAKPDFYIVKRRSAADDWETYHSGLGATYYGKLNATDAWTTAGSTARWNDTEPTSSVFSVGTTDNVNGSGSTYVAYCFANVPGYQRAGKYTGNGSSTGPVVVTGFRPRFLLVTRTDSAGSWVMLDSERNQVNPRNKSFYADTNGAEYTPGQNWADFDESSFQITATYGEVNANNGTYIYLAIGDDEIGSEEDCLVDVPNAVTADADATDTTGGYQRGNYATLNPLDHNCGSATFSEANLKIQTPTNSGGVYVSTIATPTTGKWYAEVKIVALSANQFGRVGLVQVGQPRNTAQLGNDPGQISYRLEVGDIRYNMTTLATGGSAASVGDIIGLALDLDNQTLRVTRNGAHMTTASNIPQYQWFFAGSDDYTSYSATHEWNFGQQGFKYGLPTGYAALNTTALPAATIPDGSAYFDTLLWTGDGASSTREITGLSMENAPDWIWAKERNGGSSHALFDAVRGFGSNNVLKSNSNHAEGISNGGYINSTSKSSITWAQGSSSAEFYDLNNKTYVAWCWDAGSSTVSNTDGSVTASVRANTSAGFSICTFTSPSSGNFTFGHGLNAVPEFVIVKTRGATSDWSVYHQSISTTTSKYLVLNTTMATDTYNYVWGAALPTTSVVGLTSGGAVATSQTCVAYCFTSVAGYSAFGSYEGNGSSDGPFVYTGFRPALVIIKRTDSAEQWYLNDAARDTFNVTGKSLRAQSSSAEASTGGSNSATWDILSNGFKLRDSGGGTNASGGDYIYMAWAENPFQANGGLAR